MPPRRRTAASNGQGTLSFGNQSRVTKPSTAPSTHHKAKNLETRASIPSDNSVSGTPEPQQIIASDPSRPHVAELAVRQQAAAEVKKPLSEEDQRALKLSKQDLQRYWKKEEQSRKAPRGELSQSTSVADLELTTRVASPPREPGVGGENPPPL